MAVDSVNSLVSLVDAKAWCAVKTADTTYDTILENFIDGVSWEFNKYTNRLLKARDITAYYTGDGSDKLQLPEYPVNSITSIYIDVDRAFTADTELTDYQFYDIGIIVSEDQAFPNIAKSIKITYNAGYATIPYDLQMAAKDQIKWLFKRHRQNQEGGSTITTQNGTETLTETGELLTTVKGILDRYRKRDHGNVNI